MDPTTQHRRAVVMLIGAAVLWSTSGVLIKVSDWTPMAILSGRSLVAALLFLAYLRPRRLYWTRIQVIGALCAVAAQLSFIMATKLTTAANAIFLQYAAPIYVVLFGWWLLDERPERADWLTMPAIFAGLLLFLGDDLTWDGFLGNALAVFSGVAMALLFVTMRMQKRGNPANTILLGNFIGAAVGLPWLLRANFTPQNIAIMGYLGVFQFGLAFALYSAAIKHVPALESTLILVLEPILNPVWVFLALGERPGPQAMLGAVLVLGTVFARAIYAARKPVPEPGRG